MHILKDIGIISDISVYFKEYFLIGGGYMTKKKMVPMGCWDITNLVYY